MVYNPQGDTDSLCLGRALRSSLPSRRQGYNRLFPTTAPSANRLM